MGKSEKERRGFFGWIDEKNGSYPESVAEGIHANMPDWMRDRYDTMEVLDAVLSVVGGNPRPRDMVVDYAKRLREQSRDMDEYYADEAAGARGFADAGEMDAYDNMREREATGFHDVAAAGREADGARADLLADARARLNDPNASEYEKQAARAVLRFRQRDGRDGVTAQGTEGDGMRYRFTGSREDFDKMRDEAVKAKGLVMPGLADKQVRIVTVDSKTPFDVSLRDTALKNQVKSYAREHADEILGDVEVEGGIVNVSLTSIGEMADPKSYKSTLKNGISKEIHFAVIPKIKEIIGNSIDAEVHPDYLDRDASGMRITGRYSDHILMHRLYGAVEIDGQVYRVKTTVKEDKTNNTNRTHTYEVAEIELLESHTRPADSTSPISNNSISGANLLQDVRKSYDSGKLLLDESAKTTESGGMLERNGQSTLQGLDGYTEDEVLSMVREDIEEKLAADGVDGVRINGMAIHGSRKRGDARPDSDLDVVVEYDGDISEDGLFNLLNDVPLTIEGVEVDINPITEGKSGTLEQYMERSRRYDASKKADSGPLFRIRGEHETGDRVRVRREGMNDGRVRVEGLPGEWRNIDEAGRAMRLADPEHLYVPSDDGKWLEVHDWRDNEVWDIWRGKPGSKRYEKWRERTLNHIHKQVPEYAKKLGLDVELIEDESAVPAGHENEKSWYDAETGKIHIVVPRHAAFDVSDVMSSLWHEGVSRHGLRKLEGDDNYDTFLDNVYATSDANIRSEIDRLAEQVEDRKVLDKIKETITRKPTKITAAKFREL